MHILASRLLWYRGFLPRLRSHSHLEAWSRKERCQIHICNCDGGEAVRMLNALLFGIRVGIENNFNVSAVSQNAITVSCVVVEVELLVVKFDSCPCTHLTQACISNYME